MSRPDERFSIWYRDGNYIDVKNLEGVWTVGLVKSADNVRGYSVLYEDNQKSIQTWLGKASERIAPFRQQSTMKELTLATRKSGVALEGAVRNLTETIQRTPTIPMEVVQLYRGELLFRALELLELNPRDEEITVYSDAIRRLIQHCGKWMQNTLNAPSEFVENLKTKDAYLSSIPSAYASCWPEIFTILSKLLNFEAQYMFIRRRTEFSVKNIAIEEFSRDWLQFLMGKLADGCVPFHMIGSLPFWSLYEVKSYEALPQFLGCAHTTIKKGNNLSGSELRFFDPGSLKTLVETVWPVFRHLSQNIENVEAYFKEMILEIGLKLLQDRDRVEGRIQGLRVFNFVIGCRSSNAAYSFSVSDDQLAEKLKSSVLPIILNESNVEAINLSFPVIEFLAEKQCLETTHIGTLLRQQGHDSVITAKAQLLVKVAPKCTSHVLSLIVDTWSRQELNSATIRLMKEFTVSANQMREELHPGFLERFVELLRDQTAEKLKFMGEIFSAIVNMMKLPALASLRTVALDKLAEGIDQRHIDSMKCFHCVIYSNRDSAKLYLDQKQPHLPQKIFEWVKAAEDTKFYGRTMLLDNLLNLLLFIASLDGNSHHLDVERLKELTSVFAQDHFGEKEVELFFLWLQQLIDCEQLKSGQILNFLGELLACPNPNFIVKAGQSTLNFFLNRFYYANLQFLGINQGVLAYTAYNQQILGLETIQKLSFLPALEIIRSQATNFLNQVVFTCRVDSESSFLSVVLANAFEELERSSHNSTLVVNILSSLLSLVQYFLKVTGKTPIEFSESGILVHYCKNEQVNQISVPSTCSLGDVRKAIGGPYNRTILSDTSQRWFTFANDELKLASFGTEVYFRVDERDFCMEVNPISEIMKCSNNFYKLRNLFRETGPQQKLIWKLIAQLIRAEPEIACQHLGGWEEVTALTKGTPKDQLLAILLLHCYKNTGFENEGNIQAFGIRVLESLSNSIEQIYYHEFQYWSPELIFEFCVLLVSLVKDGPFPGNSQNQQYDSKILEGFSYLYECFVCAVQKEPALIDSEPFLWKEVLEVWTRSKEFNIQGTVLPILCKNLSRIFFSANDKLKNLFGGLLVDLKREFGFDGQLDNALISILQECLTRPNVSTEAYFKCLNEILRYGQADTNSVVPQIFQYLHSCTAEKTSAATLTGCFSILEQAIPQGCLRDEAQLARDLTELYLFPSTRNKYPLCTTPETKAKAFNLLQQLCQRNQGVLEDILSVLNTFHSNMTWRKSTLKSWIVPAQEEKTLEPFVGLRNLGATCYMNSVLQQLFMLIQFRQPLFNLRLRQQSAGVLTEVTKIMLKLAFSAKPYVSTKRLCGAYKDWDEQPINPREQMDVEEFLTGLLDKMKEESQNAAVAELINHNFCGEIAGIIRGEGECDHESRRTENQYIIPMEVKNKTTLKESLDAFVKKEVMEGDSAYNCEACGKKVTASKQQLFKKLPEVIILSLRRFDYSVELGQRKKLNDYFEFEETLDLSPYLEHDSSEDILRSMSTIREKNINPSTMYTLKGIVIHMGEAEAGHYFSLVRDAQQKIWIEFNDANVYEVDEKRVWELAFGTKSDGSTPLQVAQTSAYLLIYKKGADDLVQSFSSIRDVKIPEADEIKKKNEDYLYKKCVLKPEYCEFVKKLLEAQPSSQVLRFAVSFYCTIRSRGQMTDHYLMSMIYQQLVQHPDVMPWLANMLTCEQGIKEFLIDCPQLLVRKFLLSLLCCQQDTEERKRLLSRLISVLPKLEHPITERHSVYFEALYCLAKSNLQDVIQAGLPSFLIAQILKKQLPAGSVHRSGGSSEWGFSGASVTFPSPNSELKPHYAFHIAIIEWCLSRLNDRDLHAVASLEFMREAVAGAFNKLGGQKLASLYASREDLLDEYLACLGDYFAANDYDHYRVATVQLRKIIEKNSRKEDAVIDKVMRKLMQVLEGNRGYVLATAWLLKFAYKLASRKQKVMNWIRNNPELPRFAAGWEQDYRKFTLGQPNMMLTKVPQFFQPSIYQIVPDVTAVLQALANKRVPINTDEADSDVDSYDIKHENEAEVLVNATPQRFYFDINFGQFFYGYYQTPGGKKEEFIAADDDRLMPKYTKILTPSG